MPKFGIWYAESNEKLQDDTNRRQYVNCDMCHRRGRWAADVRLLQRQCLLSVQLIGRFRNIHLTECQLVGILCLSIHMAHFGGVETVNIIGPDEVVFGVDDVEICKSYLSDFGLVEVGDGRFEALDGTGVVIQAADDPSLPPALPTSTMLRKSVYGVADEQSLEDIAVEMERDRDVKRFDDGSIEFLDDAGFVLGFQLTVRRKLDMLPERVNAPGAPVQRPVNVVGADDESAALPRTLSHIVYFVPDIAESEAFYVNRLGFVVTDTFKGAGPFLRPRACRDHHALFLIQTPEYMQGLEHLAFHVQGPTELMLAGTRLVEKGYESFWGPGRHKLGSNWFWYFNSPMATHFEYDADMDVHDENWKPRTVEIGAESSQMFLFESQPKWFPGTGPSQEDES